MSSRNMHLNSKLKWAGVFSAGVGIPVALLALNAFAFEANSGLLFMATIAAFYVFCPGFWFDLNSAYLIRNAIIDSVDFSDNFMVFIFWSLINGALYLIVLHLLERLRASKAKLNGGTDSVDFQ